MVCNDKGKKDKNKFVIALSIKIINVPKGGDNVGDDQNQKPGLGEQIANEAKRAAANEGKKLGKKAARQALKVVGKAIKKVATQVIMAIIRLFANPYVLVPTLIIVLLVLAASIVLNLFTGGEDGFSSTTGASYSAFGCNMTRQQFIDACQNYTGSLGDLSSVEYEGIIYDVCSKNNINPCYVMAMAKKEGQRLYYKWYL